MLIIANTGFSQCENWNQIENAGKVQDSYTLYRDYFRRGKFEKALPHWEIVYQNAPASNGKRNLVYLNGRELYFDKFKIESNESEKKKIANFILQLYKEEQICFPKSNANPLPKEVIDYIEKSK